MGYGCLQTTFCVFNALITVLAAVCVGLGAWALTSTDSFLNRISEALKELPDTGITAQNLQGAAIVIVIIGSVIMLIAGIGCCGAAKNNKCLLGVFFIAMVIICIIVIVAVVLTQLYSRDKINAAFTDLLKKYKEDQKEQLDKIQEILQCCGVNGPEDFTEGGGTLPASCKTYKTGCEDRVVGYFTKGPIFIAAIVTLVFLVLATLISGYLYCKGDGQAV